MIYVYIVVAVLVLYLIGFFNSTKVLQNRIKASIQEIGNQLKRQANLIPNLADSVKSYMSHEKDIFKQLTEVRKMIGNAMESNDPAKIDKAQEMIGKILRSVRVVMESNPQIKASDLISNLMNELRDTADKIMYARRTLIDLSVDYNNKITTVPGVFLAPLFGFQAEKGLDTPLSGEFLEVSEAETKNPKINLS
jgi:LemA protein